MRGLLLLCLLASPALAEAPYDDFAAGIVPCYEAATTEAEARACNGPATRSCMDEAPDGQTTYGMTQCLIAERDAWDVLLNREYQRARDHARRADAEDAGGPVQPAREQTLRDAQRAWITFRDANCAMAYAAWGAGSMRMIAGADCSARMTFERVMELRDYGRER